jgi:hypothetical protein
MGGDPSPTYFEDKIITLLVHKALPCISAWAKYGQQEMKWLGQYSQKIEDFPR